jgi:hypothetical protein
MKLHIPIIACLLAAVPAAALAQQQNDHHQSYQSRSSQQAPRESQRYSGRTAQPQQRYNAQPQQRYSQPMQRYNAQPQQRYNAPVQRYNAQPQQRYYTQPQERYQARTYVQGGYGYGHYASRGFVVARRDVDPWYWNRGLAWAPSPAYWGGGFWGLFSLNLAFNEPAPANYYYQVTPSSPGAQLLANYGLTQTDCNQPNLVDIIGPDGSEICAYPNDEVGPGQYNVDPSTLSLVSAD